MTKAPSLRVGLQRILKIADFVGNLPEKRFDFSQWSSNDKTPKMEHNCGTTACALGWATAMPYFQKLGLRLTKWGYPTLVLRGRPPKGVSRTSFDLVRERVFGGIGLEDFSLLFVPGWSGGWLHSDATPGQWARHAERIVDRLAKANDIKLG